MRVRRPEFTFFAWASPLAAADGSSFCQSRLQARFVRDFHKREIEWRGRFCLILVEPAARKSLSGAGSVRNWFPVCTKSGHWLVDGLHSIEKTDSCRREFSIDGKNRRSRTGSFFDSFLKFFRLARRPGLERSHSPDRKVGREGEQGSIAKRWSRRTKKKR